MKKILTVLLLISFTLKAEVSFMTLNTWRKDNYDRIPLMAMEIRKLKRLPDLIFLQEAMAYTKHNNHHSTAKNLADLLGLNSVFKMRSSDKEGLALLSPWKIKNSYTVALPQSEKESYKRILLVGEIQHPSYGLIRAYNVHLSSKEGDSQKRIEQLVKCFKEIRNNELKSKSELIVLAGDFNARPGSPEIKLVDSLMKQHFKGHQYRNDNSKIPTWASIKLKEDFSSGKRLDYIFVNSKKSLKFKSEKFLFDKELVPTERVFRKKNTNKIWVSDHKGLIHSYY